MESDPHEHDADPAQDGVLKPFLEHLEDLRWMLIKMIVVLGSAMILSFFFAAELMDVMIRPLARVTDNPEDFLRTLQVTGGFTLAMKLAFYAGIVLSAPVLMYFLGQFLLPALTEREKRLLRPSFVGGAGLFIAGVALAYFVVIPAGLKFFIEFNNDLGIRSEWTINSYTGFVSQMMLAFGICFELPLVILILAKLGIVTHEFLRQKRPYVIVIIMIVSAVVTPTADPVNMTLLALPMALLYEACVWIARFMEQRKARRQNAA